MSKMLECFDCGRRFYRGISGRNLCPQCYARHEKKEKTTVESSMTNRFLKKQEWLRVNCGDKACKNCEHYKAGCKHADYPGRIFVGGAE